MLAVSQQQLRQDCHLGMTSTASHSTLQDSSRVPTWSTAEETGAWLVCAFFLSFPLMWRAAWSTPLCSLLSAITPPDGSVSCLLICTVASAVLKAGQGIVQQAVHLCSMGHWRLWIHHAPCESGHQLHATSSQELGVGCVAILTLLIFFWSNHGKLWPLSFCLGHMIFKKSYGRFVDNCSSILKYYLAWIQQVMERQGKCRYTQIPWWKERAWSSKEVPYLLLLSSVKWDHSASSSAPVVL